MTRLIGLTLLASISTYLAVPVALKIYLNVTGFQRAQANPLIALLYIPLAIALVGIWALVIVSYKRFNKLNSHSRG